MIKPTFKPWAIRIGYLPSRYLQRILRRTLAVRELPWCAPSESPNRRRRVAVQDMSRQNVLDPIDRFGIVAAMGRNRVIGVNGRIPWSLPEDRKLFESLTTNGILIMGRRTLEEEPNRSHISHAARCIVISRTLPDDVETEEVKVARSFVEALHLAKQLKESLRPSAHECFNETLCWVIGGEAVYHEALLHPAAACLHLTIVGTDIENNGEPGNTAYFPAKYRWDNKFHLESRESRTSASGLVFEHFIYSRIKGRR